VAPGPFAPGDRLRVRAAFDAPTGRGRWGGAQTVRLEAGQGVVVDRLTDMGRLLLVGFWASFDPARFEKA
jgi:hypothetical protein